MASEAKNKRELPSQVVDILIGAMGVGGLATMVLSRNWLWKAAGLGTAIVCYKLLEKRGVLPLAEMPKARI
ncbi:MAG: hypothetical protein WC686_05035 [Candidatus Shapirobacteria bacterium]|jgi:hypothetical protein